MVQLLTLKRSEEKTISVLKQVRNSIFFFPCYPDYHDQIASLSFLRKNPYYQGLIKFSTEHLSLAVDKFKDWLSIPTYLTFQHNDGSLLYALASKRGNRVYEHYVKKKLTESLSFMNEPDFSKFILRDKKGHRVKKVSNLMFISLSTNPKFYGGSIVRAWLQIEKYYNIFVTRLRKKYGKCWIMKANESHKNGYPHIHLLVLTEKEFDVFSHKNKKGFIEYRLKDKNNIASWWNSFIDVIVPNLYGIKKGNTLDAVKDYIFKDMLKSYSFKKNRSYEDNLSLAMGWLFGKRCYSVSKHDFVDLITDTSLIQTQIEDIKEEFGDQKLTFLGLTDFKTILSGRPPPYSFKIKKEDPNYEIYLNSVY
jgi:hypothetical protein